jgi:Tol biopolymer transport system component
VVDGWIGDNVILRSGRPGHEGNVYLVRASDGAVRSLFAAQLTKAMFVPSPDGSLLAWAELNTASQMNTLKVIAPDGSTYRELATFSGTLYPIIWSPQITYIAFNVYGAPKSVGDEVYIIRRDGRDLRQVLRTEAVQRLLFSPDGQYLVVASGGSDPFTVIDLATMTLHVLRLSQAQPDHAWRLVGWAAP